MPREEDDDMDSGSPARRYSRSPSRSPSRSRSRSPLRRRYSRSPPRRISPERRVRRSHEDDEVAAAERRPPRRSASPDAGPETMFRVLAPSRLVGSLIGKGGRTINAIRDSTKARIKVVESFVQHADERVVIISAPDEEDVAVSRAQEALFQVHSKLKEQGSSIICGSCCFWPRVLASWMSSASQVRFEAMSGPVGYETYLTSGKQHFRILSEAAREEGTEIEGRVTLRMLITGGQAGCLIGKGGVTIRSLRERSSASVRVLPPEETPVIAGPMDRVLQLVGEESQTLTALELASKQLRQAPPEPPPRNHYPSSRGLPPPRGGRFDGRDHRSEYRSDRYDRDRYERGRRSRSRSRDRSPRRYDRGARRDSDRDRDRDRDRDYDRPERGGFSDRRGGELPPPPGAGGFQGGGPPPPPPAVQFVVPGNVPIPGVSTQVTAKMTLSKALIGAVIGKGGSNIAQIRQVSNAKVKIHEQEEGSEDRVVEMSGSAEEVQAAQNIIQAFLLQSPAGQQAAAFPP